MRYIITCLITVMLTNSCISQKATFDLATFSIPAGWKKEIKTDAVSYTSINNKNSSWCILAVYKNTASTGNAGKDFDNEWNELIVRNTTVIDGPEKGTAQKAEGWEIIGGAGKASFNGAEMMVLLTTFTGYNTCVSIVAKTNHADYLQVIEDFIGSVDLKKPDQKNTSTQNNTIKPASNSKFRFNTSNFDDGWTSTIYNDYVFVTKGNTNIYLNFLVPYNVSQFSGTGIDARDYYWDNYVAKQFKVSRKQYRDGDNMSFRSMEYVEGWGTDLQSGRKCFIGMYLSIVPNAVSAIIVTTPNESSFRQQFPKANDSYSSELPGLNRYNKFAVAQTDIIGKWENGNTSTMHWAYVSPSGYEGYAGMTVAATSAVFQFNSNSSYNSIHNGATGSVGNMNTFQQEYKGKYTVSNWNITATNRFGGKTDKFDVSFKAVKGGRVLLMSNGGQTYQLIKTK